MKTKTKRGQIRTNILVGLLLLAPIGITAAFVKWLFNWFTGLFLGFFPKKLWEQTDYELLLRFASLLAVLFLLFMIGLLVRNVLGRRLYLFWDRLMTRIPLVSRIYLSIRQIFEALLSNRETLFQEVVLVQYPSPGLYTMAFVTGIVPESIAANIERRDASDEVVSLFLPTTPNPTSGWLLIVPRSKLIPLPLTTGDAMKLVMSGGGTFGGRQDANVGATLIHKVDAWVESKDTPKAS